MMRVFITGATGFIGYHTTRELIAAGHEVHLLVRSVDKMNGLFGEGVIEHYTVGDIADAQPIREAMGSCDAVIHVAALVSTRASDARQVFETNLQGVKSVLGQAVELGLDPVIHVSSVTALYNPDAASLNEESPPGSGARGYGRSKVACEEYARSLQEQGHPVSITYPATVLGPEAPGLTEAHEGICTYLQQFVPLMPSGNQYVDVRDIARVHLDIIDHDVPSNRYVLAGHYLSWRELGAELERLTGRELRKIPLGGGLMRLAGRVCDALGPHMKEQLPMSLEGVTYATRWVKMDDSRVQRELDFAFRPVEETFTDTIRWMCQAGHITAGEAGQLIW